MAGTGGGVIEQAVWKRMDREYYARWHVRLYVTDADGGLVFGKPPCRECDQASCRQARAFSIREALRWGEPSVDFCPEKRLIWTVPLMYNERILGGLTASVAEQDFFRCGKASFDLRLACTDLRELAEAHNITNASALTVSRTRYQHEQRRAYALHAFKSRGHDSIRELYLFEEPALFAAIRAGDRPAAREIFNRILVAIHHHAGSRLELVKSLFLELVVSITRTAVESGGAPEEMLGVNFSGMTELAVIDSEEALAVWLSGMLEHIMDAIRVNRKRDPGQVIFDALDYMQRHCGENISRDDAAAAAHITPSHFSYLMRKESGVTFTEMLNRLRIDRAVDLMTHTDKPLSIIALECGFEDQSYFTKVFKRYRHNTPLQYRQSQQRE